MPLKPRTPAADASLDDMLDVLADAGFEAPSDDAAANRDALAGALQGGQRADARVRRGRRAVSTGRHEYASLASLAREKARSAMHQGNPDLAQRWIAAAADADDALIAAHEAMLEAQVQALADGIRELIAALEEAPALGEIEARLLTNLRQTLAEWER